MKETKRPTIRMKDLTQEEKDNFVGAFAWLIKEDKKQNPHLYKKKIK